MAIEIYKDIRGIAEITAIFAGGGRLEKAGTIWTYESDGRSSMAIDPESAVIGAEGLSRGREVWNSYFREQVKGGE